MTAILPVLPKPGTKIAAEDVASWEERVEQSVELVDSLDALSEWLDQARALESYLRSRELQRPMLGAQRRIEARIGQLLGPAPGKGYDERSAHAHSIAKERRGEFRVIARALNGDTQLAPDEWRKSRRALLSLIRQRLGLIQTPPLPDGTFRCIVADPPWQLDTGPDTFNGTVEGGHDSLAYEQMTIDEIKALAVDGVIRNQSGEPLPAPDAHLYLWTTNRHLEAAYAIARAWGFKPSVLLIWAKKPRGIGLGDTYRLTTEFILFARRGTLDHKQVIPTTWFDWPRGRHSEKPAAFYAMAEKVTPGPYVDLFARTEREGWTVWGNEIAA